MRHYFKKSVKEDKFFKFCKDNGADYIEDGEAVWMKPKKSKGCIVRSAISLDKSGCIYLGKIVESCLNFETDGRNFSQESQKWIIKILTILQKYKP